MPLRFTLRQLEYFLAVGQTGSVTLAAEKMHVSAPSISAAISQLEADFGLQLFVRKHAKGLALTQAGRQLLAKAAQVLAQAEEMNRLVGGISGQVQGDLSLGCLLTFAQILVPSLRRSFETRFPMVRVHHAEKNQQEIIDALRGGEMDIALTYDLAIPEDLQFIPLVSLPPYVLLPDGHPLANLSQITVQALRDEPMVLLDLPLSSEYFLSFFRASGIKPKIAERTRDMAVMRGLVANGYGYSIANIRPLNDLAPDGRKLRFVPLVGEVGPMMLGLVMARGAEGVLTIAAFIEHCRAQITIDRMPGQDLRPV
ncbi:LysR substrate-binding domain-containing protein [Tabrizicola sp.]|jgi:DNA-binding transcriptional LysR family regulator|uniref:LysR substrate-binding domain-containing protein n=1 Tax=Tabrizicola sp. TaxID=2005166 RepID=UPI003D2B006E